MVRDSRTTRARAQLNRAAWKFRFAVDFAIGFACLSLLGWVLWALFGRGLPQPVVIEIPAPTDPAGAVADPEPAARAAQAEIERRERTAREQQAEAARRAEEAKARDVIAAQVRQQEAEQAQRRLELEHTMAGLVDRLAGEDAGDAASALDGIRALIDSAELDGDAQLTFAGRTRAALESRRDTVLARLWADPRGRAYVELRDHKQRLNELRRAALTHIHDTEAYPYHPERGDHGEKGQAEVDRQVNAVRALWDRRHELFVKLDVALAPLIETVRAAEAAAVEWGGARAIADGECAQLLEATGAALDLAAFCVDDRERAARAWNRAVRAFNRHPPGDLHADEMKVIELTNDYREMLGLRLLEAHAGIARAAREHSSWMAARGTLSHEQDVPERKTLDQRVALQGYAGLAGENIASGATDAAMAFLSWLRSSGHHRNLLEGAFNQIGVGKVRLYWTQDFGHSEPQCGVKEE